MGSLRFAIATLAFCLLYGVAGPTTAEIPPDTNFEQRQNQVLEKIAKRHTDKSSYDSCFNFGASAIALVAKLELGNRGLGGGVTPSDASGAIERIADVAISVAGDASDKCVWSNAGSPGTMHGLLAIGMILHRHRDDLSSGVVQKLEKAADGYWRGDLSKNLVNASIAIVAGRLLAGESMGYNSSVWQKGKEDFDAIYEYTAKHGGIEVNAPIYTAYQFAALIPLMDLEHDGLRQKSRIMLEYLFLVQSHLYLPDGGLGGPQARDYGGGAYDSQPSSLHRMARLYAGTEKFEPSRNVHLIGAAVDYELPEAIRSIYLDKGDGYDFTVYTPAPVTSRHGRGYDVGLPYNVAPWRAVVTPDAMFGVNHGFRYQSIHVSMGVYAKTGPDSFPILYHYQPYIDGQDKTRTGGGLPSGGNDTDPDDFTREMYDYRRMVHDRTMISIWDPTEQNKHSNEQRGTQDTRAHVPDYSAYGGEMRTDNTGGWLVGRAGNSYIAYRPLGTIDVGPDRRSSFSGRSSEFYYLRLDGRSGAIVELATTDDFATIDDYVADLKQRHLQFSTADPITAEFDALDPETGGTERIRLEYAPETHIVDGNATSVPDAVDGGWMDSDFLEYDDGNRTLHLRRECYREITYDLSAGSVDTSRSNAPECVGEPLEETTFSNVQHFGDFANYEPDNPDRWHVVEQQGDRRLYLAPYEYEPDEDRLGELAVADDRSYEDFELTLEAKTNEDLDRTENADYAVVFGYQDRSNYYFMLTNANPEYSELFVLENGTRTQLGRASRPLVPDDEWHDLTIVRDGDQIIVRHDGDEVLTVSDGTYESGRIGVGTLNDSALFDNIAVTRPGDGDDAGDPDTGVADTGSMTDEDTGSTSEPDTGSDPGGDDTDTADTVSDIGSSDADTQHIEGSGGCNCSTGDGDRPRPPLAILVALTGLFLARRRRAS